MTKPTPELLSNWKTKALPVSNQDLEKFDSNTYPLGLNIYSNYRDLSLLKSFRETISISTGMKNEAGHSGLLILGWGGVGKTALANTIARKAHLDGHQIIRYYQHEGELNLGEGTSKFTNPTEFLGALTELSEADTIQPTVVIIDSLESYLIESCSERRTDENELSCLDRLNELLAVKTTLEERFADSILFVFALKADYGMAFFPVIRGHVALTITGRIHAHYAIRPLWDKTSSSRFFWKISELKTGQFVVLEKKLQTIHAFT